MFCPILMRDVVEHMAEDIKQEHVPEHMANDDMHQHVPEHMANDNMPTSGTGKRKEKKDIENKEFVVRKLEREQRRMCTVVPTPTAAF